MKGWEFYIGVGTGLSPPPHTHTHLFCKVRHKPPFLHDKSVLHLILGLVLNLSEVTVRTN